jgi:Ca2+-binding EF-hand superfamily protein
MDLGSRYQRTASSRSPSTERFNSSPSRAGRSPSGRGTRRSPQREAAAAGGRAAASRYSHDTVASRGRRSGSRSPTPPPARSGAAVGSSTAAADALREAIADSSVRLDGRKFRDVRSFFELVDTRASGAVGAKELRDALVRLDLGLARAELRACYDIGRGSTIELHELERWLQRGGTRRLSSPNRRDGPRERVRERKALARRLAQTVGEEVGLALRRNQASMASAFRQMDADGSGSLTPAEFRQGLRSLTGKGATAVQLRLLMTELDKDRDGRVDYGEFLAAVEHAADARRLARSVTERLRQTIMRNRDSLLQTFDEFDENGDGVLSAKEFRRGLKARGIVLQQGEMQQLMQVMDTDGNDTLDYREFIDAVEQIGDTSDDMSSDFTDDQWAERRGSLSSDGDSTFRFSRHGVAAYDDDSTDDNVADLQRQVRLLRDQLDDYRGDEYMMGGAAVGLSGKARARQLRNRMKAGRLQGMRQSRSLIWYFGAWKNCTAEKARENAERTFAGQWHIVGSDHDGQSVEEWIIVWIGTAGDVHCECFTRKPAGHATVASSRVEHGKVIGDRLRFTQVYPHSGERTKWELTSRGGRDQLAGSWKGAATGEFAAQRCQLWVDSHDVDLPQTTPRGLRGDSSIGRSSTSPRAAHGASSSSPQRRRASARRLAHVVTEEILEKMAEHHRSLASTFSRMDKTRSGSLSPAEFRQGLRSLTGTVLTQPQMRLLMTELDKDGDDRVDYGEFVAAVMRTADARRLARSVTERLRQDIRINRDSLLHTFDEFDENGDGVLSAKEFRRGLKARGIVLQQGEMQQLMQVMDTDGNDTLDYLEFIDAIVLLGSNSTDTSDIGGMRRSPPKLTVRTPGDDDFDFSPRSTGSGGSGTPRQRSSGRAGTPALITAIAQRLDELDGWQTSHLFRPRNRLSSTKSDVQELLEQLRGGRADTSLAISHKVTARTQDPRTLIALLYAWLLDLPDSPVPKTMFHDCKLVVDRPEQEAKVLSSLVKDMPEPGQSIVRAVVDLYRRIDPDRLDMEAINKGLAPALMHSPQGAEQKWNYGDFVALLVQELPGQSEDHGRRRRRTASPRRKHGPQQQQPDQQHSLLPQHQQRTQPYSYRAHSTDDPDFHQTGGSSSSSSPGRRRRSPSPGALESLFGSCPGRSNSGGSGGDDSRRGGRGGSPSQRRRNPTPFGSQYPASYDR